MTTELKVKDWWSNFWGTLQHSPAILPTRHAVLGDHADTASGQTFKRNQHYFVVRVNRIFLKYGREFWTTYAPMALVVSEFSYNGKDLAVPFFVGPSMLEKDKIELPSWATAGARWRVPVLIQSLLKWEVRFSQRSIPSRTAAYS